MSFADVISLQHCRNAELPKPFSILALQDWLRRTSQITRGSRGGWLIRITCQLLSVINYGHESSLDEAVNLESKWKFVIGREEGEDEWWWHGFFLPKGWGQRQWKTSNKIDLSPSVIFFRMGSHCYHRSVRLYIMLSLTNDRRWPSSRL